VNKEQPPQQNELPLEERFPIGRSIVNRIRTEVNDEGGPFAAADVDDLFALLYLTERDGCVPDEILSGEDLTNDIRNLYYCVFDGVRSELKERLPTREFLWVIVDASYEDATEYVLMTDEKVLVAGHAKAWNFYWSSEDEMARDLEEWYRGAASRLTGSQPALTPEQDGPGRYAVRLDIERSLTVDAENREQALDRAVRWQSNEDDDGVAMIYEDVTGSRVERTEHEE
jgi:hypothetical protein